MDTLSNWFAGLDFIFILYIACKILVILLLCRLTIAVINRIIKRLLCRQKGNRAGTASVICRSFFRYSIWAIGAMMILSLLGVNIVPIIASAGVLGIALGFGAQSLVKDVLGGFFMLLDNYYELGEYISTEKASGFVEEIGLRTTKLRDWGGQLYILPNGSITGVTNYSRGQLSSIVEIPLAYGCDWELALDIIKKAAAEMEAACPELSKGPQVLGLDRMEENRVVVKLSFASGLQEQLRLQRELRQRVGIALEKSGIKLPAFYRQQLNSAAGEAEKK
ncbi:MAG: mechanosensitive ion channel family protein [Clostridiales bacterium]|jgi:small conductance mechanosensitive channel|nr:mechanosensitive ion channel family protein [Clostridiales bacterium]